MTARSHPPDAERISATEASRSFSRLLDDIESGRRYLVYRHGRDICVMLPAPASGRRASECLALLRERTPVWLDEQFGKDLQEALHEEPVEERPAWGY
jgi:antitoxin (DNA-binding transcriptional repressor) of toxin-antitoxin stability system